MPAENRVCKLFDMKTMTLVSHRLIYCLNGNTLTTFQALGGWCSPLGGRGNRLKNGKNGNTWATFQALGGWCSPLVGRGGIA